MAKLDLPTLADLLKHPKQSRRKLDNLTDAQLVSFVQSIKDLLRGFGRPSDLPATPAEFALKFSRSQWKLADHLVYISKKLVQLEARKIKRLLISTPPRHGKSWLTDVYFPAWFLARNPTARIILVGYGDTFARDWGGKVRDLILDYAQELNLLVDKDHTAADAWELSAGGGMICVGAGGALMGRGADLLIFDDVIKNAEEADSQTYRDKIWNWYQSTAMTRLQPNAVVVGLMTRWHQDDLFGRILGTNSGEWEVVNIPALAEPDDPLGRPEGAPLWPSFWQDPDYYTKLQASISPYYWSSLYQGHPTPRGGGVIKEDWFRFYRPGEIEAFDQLIQSWDLSQKDKETSDFNVGQLWGRKASSLYLVDQVRGHYNLGQIEQLMRQFTLKHPRALGKLVEDAAMAPAVKARLHHELGGIVPILPKGSKWSRVQATVPLLMAGNVYLPERKDGTKERWVWEFIEECCAFDKGTYDDQVDAFTQAAGFLIPGIWSAERSEAAARELPEATPADLQREWFEREWKRAMRASDEKYGQPAGGTLQRLFRTPRFL